MHVLYVRTFCDIEAGELDWLRVVDHGREVGVDVGGGARVRVRRRQRCLLLGC